MEIMKLDVPPTRTTFGDRLFAVNGPQVWNSLPASICDPSPEIYLLIAIFAIGEQKSVLAKQRRMRFITSDENARRSRL